MTAIMYGTKYDSKFRKATGEPDYTPPAGYKLIAKENETVRFDTPTDVAYGANGSFAYLKGITGDFTFGNSTIGSDPAFGVIKGGYAKVISTAKATSFLKKYGIIIAIVAIAGALYWKFGRKGKKS